ncbi:MAG: hypothetical protein M0P13_06020, partial [Fibrobacteraceae bacterium]|nr:hypothetical protein [Fibrobacteraceae bacterium]
MKHKLAVFGLFVGCATGGAFAALPSITVSDFELAGKYQCDATGDGNMWTFADSLSSVTNVTADANGNPVGLLVNDPDGCVSGDGYARVVVEESCVYNPGYGCSPTAGFGIGFGKDLSRTYADSEDAANYGGRKIYDLTGLDSIDFWVKGTAPGVNASDTNGYWRIQLQSPVFNRKTFTDRRAQSGYDNNYGYNIPKSRLKANTWVHIVIPVDSLTFWYGNNGWGDFIRPSKDLVLQYVTGVEFVGVGEHNQWIGDGIKLNGELKVDNLRFVGLSALNPQEGAIPKLVSGNVNSKTTWGPGLYYVMGDINVYDTLTIEPGTRVVFQGNYSLNVAQNSDCDWDEASNYVKCFSFSGALVAKGTAADSIYFTAADTSVGWGGLQFSGGDGDLRYASFSYGKNNPRRNYGNGGCLYVGTESVSVADSRFYHCTADVYGGENYGGAIYNGGQLSISGSTFDGNTTSGSGGAIYNSGGNLNVSRSQFFRNSGNVAVLYNIGTASISSSLFAYNVAT